VELTRNSFSSDESQQRNHSSSSSSVDDFVNTHGDDELWSNVYKTRRWKERRRKIKNLTTRKAEDQEDETKGVKQKQQQVDSIPRGADIVSSSIIQKRKRMPNEKRKLTLLNETPADRQIASALEEGMSFSSENDNSEALETASQERNDATVETVTMTDDHSRFSLRSSSRNISESSERTGLFWTKSDDFSKSVPKSYADDVSSDPDSSSEEIKDESFSLRFDATNSLLQSTSEAESNLSPRRIQFQYSGEDDSPLLGQDALTHESQSEESLNPRQDYDLSLAAETEETAPDDTSEHSRRNSSMVVQACGAISRCVSTLPCCSKNSAWQIDSVPRMPLSSERPDPPATLSSALSFRASDSPSRRTSRDEEVLGALFDTNDSLLRIVGSMHDVESEIPGISSTKVVEQRVLSATKSRNKDMLSPGRTRLHLTPFSKSNKKVLRSDDKLKEYFQWVLLDLQRSSKEFSKGQKVSLRRTLSEPSFEETGNFPATVRDVRRPSLGNENTGSPLPHFDPKLKPLISGDFSEKVNAEEINIGISKGAAPLSPILNVASSPERISLAEMQRSTRDPLHFKDEDQSYQEALFKWKQAVTSKQEEAPGTELLMLEEARDLAKDSLVSRYPETGKPQQEVKQSVELLAGASLKKYEFSGEASMISILTTSMHSLGIILMLLVGIRLCSHPRIATDQMISERCFTPQWIQLEAGIQCKISPENPEQEERVEFSELVVQSSQRNGSSACYTPAWLQVEAGIQCNKVAETRIKQISKKFGLFPALPRGSDTPVVKSINHGASVTNELRTVKSNGADEIIEPTKVPSRLGPQRFDEWKERLPLWRREFLDWLIRKTFLDIEGDLRTPSFLQI
jgi:hypothetical protein